MCILLSVHEKWIAQNAFSVISELFRKIFLFNFVKTLLFRIINSINDFLCFVCSVLRENPDFVHLLVHCLDTNTNNIVQEALSEALMCFGANCISMDELSDHGDHDEVSH